MVVGINHKRKSFTVLENKTGNSWSLFFSKKAKVKADKKVRKTLGKKPVWEDLKPGCQADVKFLETSREVLSIKLLAVPEH